MLYQAYSFISVNFTAWKGFDNTIQDIQDGDVGTYIAQQDVESYHKVLGMRKAELVWGNPGLQSKQQEGQWCQPQVSQQLTDLNFSYASVGGIQNTDNLFIFKLLSIFSSWNTSFCLLNRKAMHLQKIDFFPIQTLLTLFFPPPAGDIQKIIQFSKCIPSFCLTDTLCHQTWIINRFFSPYSFE